ncbi:lipid-A-disaccharide synthase-related protein [Cyanobium sp. FGCU-52]|nr:lipid-A-disaccharide synthase-related protein [Cyanobium sp. FGCU52]
MSRVLLLSNGHGEDLSGSLLARLLLERGVTVAALPLVGHGRAYRQAGVPVLGSTREFSTGGLGYTSLAGRLTELIQGQVLYMLGKAWQLWRHRRRFDLVVAVGDVVPLVGAWLTGLPAAVYLVAYSSHYEGRLRLPWPAGPLLRRRRCLRVWSRDALTASDLSEQLRRPVTFLGNPFLDPVAIEPKAHQAAPAQAQEAEGVPSLGLLPGSRLPEAAANLELMLDVLARLPAPLQGPGALRLRAALVGDLSAERVGQLAASHHWQLETRAERAGGTATVLRRGELVLELVWDGFAGILAGSDLLLSMAGTAAEQAVGLGRPVLQLAGRGPQFTEGFAEAQRRLLGPGVICAEGEPGSEAVLTATAALVADLLAELGDPERGPLWRRQLARNGQERIGRPGGSARMAAAIMELLPPVEPATHG